MEKLGEVRVGVRFELREKGVGVPLAGLLDGHLAQVGEALVVEAVNALTEFAALDTIPHTLTVKQKTAIFFAGAMA